LSLVRLADDRLILPREKAELKPAQKPVDTPQFGEQATNRWQDYDTAEVWSIFSRPLTQDRWESLVDIDGMRCAACAIGIEQTLMALPGIERADVNAITGKALVVWQAQGTKPSRWMEAVAHAGYITSPAQPDASKQRKEQRLLLWRWLVAGFCMMQVMMYAYPVYVAEPGDISAEMLQLLRWASWVLTLPVLLFSSTPFLQRAWQDLRHLRVSMDLPVALGIGITFLLSSAATFDPSGWWGREVYFDSLTMFVFFLLTGRWFESRLRDRTAGALDALSRRVPRMATRRSLDGEFVRVTLDSLKDGDVVRVSPGEAFPGDGVILTGTTSADEALLTGESIPVPKPMGADVIAGSYNLAASVTVLLKQVGGDTQYAQIVSLMARASVEKPRLAMLADRIARPFLVFVLVTATTAAVWLWPSGHGQALMTAVAILIVTCPCALSLATPTAMLSAAGALAKRGVLLRRLQALENLQTVDTVIFDKTGTLTEDRMRLTRVQTRRGIERDWALLVAASLAQHSLHPASRAIVEAWGDESLMQMDEVEETHGAGITARRCSEIWRLGSDRHCDVYRADDLPGSGEQLQVHLADSHGWVASFYLRERIREHAAETIRALGAMGKHVMVMSGDKAPAVRQVAQALGIDDVTAACTPQQKLARLQALQLAGHRVLMVGDGLNDGPVLAGATVSVAMGQGVPLAQMQSDIVIQNSRLSELRPLFVHAARTMRVVKQNLAWAFAYNAVCVPLAVAGWLPAWLAGLGMAASSLLVVLNASRLSAIQLTDLKQTELKQTA
jgi:Cu2+-exporting ATPase